MSEVAAIIVLASTIKVQTITVALLALVLTILVACKLHSVRDQTTRVSLSSLSGDYYTGDGCAFNRGLTLNADGTYEWTGSGCEGGVIERGIAEIARDGRLVLKARTEQRHHFLEMSKESPCANQEIFYPMRWGDRMYLVCARVEDEKFVSLVGKQRINSYGFNDYINFCCEVNSGDEPRTSRMSSSRALLRVGDEEKKVSGLPELPAQWLRYLLKKPAEGRLIKLLGPETGEVNLGTADGILPGTVLYLQSKQPHESARPADVKDVSEHSCRVHWIVSDTDSEKKFAELSGTKVEDETAPFAGQLASSRKLSSFP